MLTERIPYNAEMLLKVTRHTCGASGCLMTWGLSKY